MWQGLPAGMSSSGPAQSSILNCKSGSSWLSSLMGICPTTNTDPSSSRYLLLVLSLVHRLTAHPMAVFSGQHGTDTPRVGCNRREAALAVIGWCGSASCAYLILTCNES
jgi:hypothetical protein